jgi:hypothetical protein
MCLRGMGWLLQSVAACGGVWHGGIHPQKDCVYGVGVSRPSPIRSVVFVAVTHHPTPMTPHNRRYYLENQLSKPLLRLFGPIMDHPESLLRGEHTRSVFVRVLGRAPQPLPLSLSLPPNLQWSHLVSFSLLLRTRPLVTFTLALTSPRRGWGGRRACVCVGGGGCAETHALHVHGHHALLCEDLQVHGVQDAHDWGGEDAVRPLPAP